MDLKGGKEKSAHPAFSCAHHSHFPTEIEGQLVREKGALRDSVDS